MLITHRTYTMGMVAIGTLLLAACSNAQPGTGTESSSHSSASESFSVATSATPSSASTQSAEPANLVMNIQNFAFAEPKMTVARGTTITWINLDSAPHTVSGTSGGPDSGTLAQGQTYSYTFTTTGTFAYSCKFHPMMTGSVTVTD